ncbi:elongator complex protein 6 [Microcaecilia unicolor]|uniref:Elongator complex protein 6 n=1 Tax=Microcaecilia unicolor TaxID=1415580 RepID=A0A6P7XQI1_9AMPH|nr:elongator complex protein 6 [Microcaecilia unicolor]XP_030052918.1 elongator complex protein 6 [Microcaecilia unicolor]
MFVELNHLLNSDLDKLKQEELTLICDIKTDGSFLVHHFLSFYLRAGCKVCFVALVQSFSHYNIVAQKLGVNLTTAKERGQLVFLEGLKSSVNVLLADGQKSEQKNPLQFLSDTSCDLKVLYDFVRNSLALSSTNTWKCPVLLVDDVSVLLSLGVNTIHLLDFLHYCRATICSQLEGNMVVLVHSSDDSEDEENELLVNYLCHHSNLILQVEGLATGFCKEVHGQLRITWKGSCRQKGEKDVVKDYQYRIHDKTVTFFARGTSAAVL